MRRCSDREKFTQKAVTYLSLMRVKTAAFGSTTEHLSRLKLTKVADAEMIKSQLLCQLSYAPVLLFSMRCGELW